MNQMRCRDPPDITPQSFGASDREKLQRGPDTLFRHFLRLSKLMNPHICSLLRIPKFSTTFSLRIFDPRFEISPSITTESDVTFLPLWSG